MDERAAFERAIDERPEDASNHLVYADWLDEHGEPDEAAFRRDLGGFFQSAPRHEPIKWSDDYEYPWTINVGRLPRSMNVLDVPRWDRNNEDETETDPETGIDGPIDPIQGRAINRWSDYLQWKNYRHMEEALRRAFHAGRKQQLSRYAAAVRRTRRK